MPVDPENTTPDARVLAAVQRDLTTTHPGLVHELENLGDTQTGPGARAIALSVSLMIGDGALFLHGLHNHPLWLLIAIPGFLVVLWPITNSMTHGQRPGTR